MSYKIALMKFLKHTLFVLLAALITAAIGVFSSPDFMASLKTAIDTLAAGLPLGIGKLAAPAIFSAIVGLITGGIAFLDNVRKHYAD